MHPLPFALIGCLLLRFDVWLPDQLTRILALIAAVAGVAGCLLLGDLAPERRSRAWIAGYVLSLVALWRVLQVFEFRYAGRAGTVCGWVLSSVYGDFVWAGILPDRWGLHGSVAPYKSALLALTVLWAGMAAALSAASERLGGRPTSFRRAMRLLLPLTPMFLLTALSFDIVTESTAHEFLSMGQLVLVMHALAARRIYILARTLSVPPLPRAAPSPVEPAALAC